MSFIDLCAANEPRAPSPGAPGDLASKMLAVGFIHRATMNNLRFQTAALSLLLVVAISIELPAHAQDASEGHQLTGMSADSHERVEQMMKRYPKPTLPGVDLAWHMDRTLEYLNNSLDRRDGATLPGVIQGMPLYGNYLWPARLTHSVWDAPHCVGRLLHAITIWEDTFDRPAADPQTIDLLRNLLHDCISSEDGLAHFHPVCKATQEVDEHSQREVLLALVGLARVRQDKASLQLAGQLVSSYAAWIERDPGVAGNYTWSGRFIQALLDYHRLTGDPLGLTLAQKFADLRYAAFDDQGTYPSGHNHSMLGSMANLVEFGIYTNQWRYLSKVRRIIDHGLPKVRSSYGIISEVDGTARGEANCTADLVRMEIMLGLNGYPEYLDDAERIVRNHLLASQFLDPSFATSTEAGGEDSPPGEPADTAQATYTNAAVRCCGGFAFTQPNGLVDPENYGNPTGELVLALDLAQGAMDALIQVWRAIATRDEKGIWVNFLFSKSMDDLEIRSYLPARGRIELDIKHPSDVYVRLPKYVTAEGVRVNVDGSELPNRIVGNYLLVPQQSEQVTASIEFEQHKSVKDETIAGETYRVEWLGDTVWNMTPAGRFAPLYYPARLMMYGCSPRSGR